MRASPNWSMNGLFSAVLDEGSCEAGFSPVEGCCRELILSSSCCEFSAEVLPRLLLGMLSRDGGRTGEILVGKLPGLEDSLGGKFRN